jgi:hypothetical protein
VRGASDGDAKESSKQREKRGLLNRSTLSVNLYVTVNALQVVTVAVKALSYRRGLRATGNCHA